MESVRIACVRYLNTLPLIEGLEKLEGVELITKSPAEIAPMLEAGEADLGLASVIDAARSVGSGTELTMIPVGMIGCDGHTLTVRLCSDVAMDQVQVVHADVESHTSVALCRVILKKTFGVEPEFVPFDAHGDHDWPETVLVIGDKAVTMKTPEGRYGHGLDLGRAWKDLTGLPFVYATWMCRTGEEDSLAVRSAAAVLDRQRRRNAARLGHIASSRAEDYKWSSDAAAEYLGSVLRFDLRDPEHQAVARFFEECVEMGVIDSAVCAWSPRKSVV